MSTRSVTLTGLRPDEQRSRHPARVFSLDHGAVPRGQVARKGDEPEVHEDSVRASAALRDPPLDAGHYGWGDKAEAYGSRVVDWVSGGYKRVAR
jgi:hypothetical protein